MMMNRTKSAVDALLKLRFKGSCISTSRSFSETPFSGLESRPPLSSPFDPNSRSSDFRCISGYLTYKKGVINMDEKNLKRSKFGWSLEEKQKHPLPFVDDFTHLLEVVTEHNQDDCFKQNPIITLLDGLIFEDRIHEAYMLFKKLIKQKLCEPTTLMYNTIIKALSSNPDKTMMDDALNLFQEMVSQPDVATYTSLVSGLCKMRRWKKATLLLQEMLDKDISPEVETFNVLINTFCIEGRLQVALDVIDMMRERGISPNAATFNPIIDVHCLLGEMDEARSLVNLMVSNHVAPDTATYNSLLIGYCDNENMDGTMADDAMVGAAMLLYHDMNEKGFKPNWITYNIMIRGCYNAARFTDARTLLGELFAQGQTLGEVSYRLILDDLCHHYRFEEAFSLYHLLGEDSKLNSHVNIIHKLIYGAIRCGKLDIARKLFEGLSVKGLEPSSIIYSTMIGGLCAEGFLNDAKQMFLEMGCPTDKTYNFLLQGYLNYKCYDDIEMLLHKMEERNHCLYDLTLSLLHESVEAGSLDTTILELMNNLPRSEGVDFFGFRARQKSLYVS